MSAAKVSVRKYNHSSTGKWVVGYRDGSKRRREFFPTRAAANARADRLKVELINLGNKALSIPDQLRFEAMECSEMLSPFGRSLKEAVTHYIEHLKATERSCTTRNLVGEYLKTKQAKGRSNRHLQDLKSRLNRFADVFGASIASEISTKQIEQWLSGLGLAAQSINNYRTVLGGFFNYGIKQGYVTSSPIAGIERHTVKQAPPSILKPGELARLLAYSPPSLIPYLSVGAFAGLRSAELDRLDWADIRLAIGSIEVTATKAKSGQRRLVNISPNLAEWLTPHARKSGKVAPTNCRRMFEQCWRNVFSNRKRDNDLRHSFASYHLALHHDAAKTALQLGHGDTSMLFKHYRELVTEQEASAYFSISSPKAENVLSLRNVEAG